MDSFSAIAMGMVNKGNTSRVFDWDKALEILNERKIDNAYAGLRSDLEWTAGRIIVDGELYDEDYMYLSSTWATPVIVLNGGEEIECWCWDAAEGNPNNYTAYSKWEDRHYKKWKKIQENKNNKKED